MEDDRLIQIMRERHLATWKSDGDLRGVCCADLKLVFQHNDEIVVISELDTSCLNEQSISEYLADYDNGNGYTPYGDFVDVYAYRRFMHDMKEINCGDTPQGVFKDIISALADSGVNVDQEVARELEYIYEEIGKILKKED